jgi:ABC-2 type transport system permease protein
MFNTLHILKKEIIDHYRNKMTMIFMFAFPLVLILVLGSALSNAFKTTVSVGDIRVLYKSNLNAEANPYFHEFAKHAEKAGIDFQKAGTHTNGKKEVRLGNADGYAVLNDEGIRLYTNDRNTVESSILEGLFTSFADQYNLSAAIMKTAPSKMETAFVKQKDNYIETRSLLPKKEPGSMDYYAIVITTLICLYASLGASMLIQGERTRKTADRAAPVRKSEIFLGKLAASLIVNSICVVLVILVSKAVYKVNWGDHLWLVFTVILTEVLLSVSIGIGISMLSKTPAAARSLLMLFIQLSAFFGGAYFKIENPSKWLQAIMDLSPLTWINQAITKIIYENDLSSALPVAAANIGAALLFLTVSITALQKSPTV